MITIFKEELRSRYKVTIAVIAILLMYFFIILGMFDPEAPDLMQLLVDLKLPEGLLSAFGFTGDSTDLTSFISSYLYGFIFVVFPMIYSVITANSLVAQSVDRGYMATLLASPVPRLQIISAKISYLKSSIFAILLVSATAGYFACEILHPGLLDFQKYIYINIALLILHIAISGILFFFSAVFNESSKSLLFGGGLITIFYLIDMIASADPMFETFRLFTPFTLFDATAIVSGENVIPQMIALAVIATVSYLGATIVFVKKDISV